MREAILVVIDNGNDYGSSRLVEYIPPGDQLSGQPPGTADKDVQFLNNEGAWSGRLPAFFQYALSLWTEPNPLALGPVSAAARVVERDPCEWQRAAPFPRSARHSLHSRQFD